MGWVGADNNFRRLNWVGSKNFGLGWGGFQKMDQRPVLRRMRSMKMAEKLLVESTCRIHRNCFNGSVEKNHSEVNVDFRLYIAACPQHSSYDGRRRSVVVSVVQHVNEVILQVSCRAYWDGKPSAGGYTISVCNQLTRST